MSHSLTILRKISVIVLVVTIFLLLTTSVYAQYGEGLFGAGTYDNSSVSSGGGGGGGGGSSGGSSSGSRKSSTSDSVSTSTATSTKVVRPESSIIPLDFSFEKNISFVHTEINSPLDIIYLKTFLNEYEGESLEISGVYDASAVEAVKRFQMKYKRQVLDIWDLQQATGYVGPTTRLKINSLLNATQASCPVFTEYNGGLHGVRQSEEIRQTQIMLNSLGLYNGQYTGIWDTATNNSLIAFQELFHEVMLDPWNITKGTGYKYKTTNLFLNYLAGCDTGTVYLEGEGNFTF